MILYLLAIVCRNPEREEDSEFIDPAWEEFDRDPDGDGSEYPEDCEPNDPDVYPFAPDCTDGVDNDCDGLVDEGDPACDE